jgi:rubrerythrin
VAEFIDDDEILELAIARENDASRFYTRLAERVNSPGLRQICRQFAAEELEHKARLELEVMKTGRVVAQPTPEPHVEQDKAEACKMGDIALDIAELLLMAIKKEETSFRLYVDLAGRVSNPRSKETLLALAEEEVRHKLRVQAEYENARRDLP